MACVVEPLFGIAVVAGVSGDAEASVIDASGSLNVSTVAISSSLSPHDPANLSVFTRLLGLAVPAELAQGLGDPASSRLADFCFAAS